MTAMALPLRLLVSTLAVASAATSAGAHPGMGNLRSPDQLKSFLHKPKEPSAAELHRFAKKASTFLEGQARKLGSADLDALALKVGQLPLASEKYSKTYAQMKEMIYAMYEAGNGAKKGNEADLDHFCATETKSSEKVATNMAARFKKLEATLGKEAADADAQSQKVAKLEQEVKATETEMSKLDKKRKRDHAKYLKVMKAEKKEQEKLKPHHGKISMANAAQIQKETIKADTMLQHRMEIQSNEAAAAIEVSHKKRMDARRIKDDKEQEANTKHLVKDLQEELMKQAQEYKELDLDIGHMKTYREQLASKCQAKAQTKPSAQSLDQHVKALMGAFRILGEA